MTRRGWGWISASITLAAAALGMALIADARGHQTFRLAGGCSPGRVGAPLALLVVAGLAVIMSGAALLLVLRHRHDSLLAPIVNYLTVALVPPLLVVSSLLIAFHPTAVRSMNCVTGRPLRTRRGSRRTRATRAARTEREALAQLWLNDALGEHESIATFADLSLRLLGLGAPESLVRRAHLAAQQEVRHARLTLALASRYANAPLRVPVMRDLLAHKTGRRLRSRRSHLTRLVRETLIDGCWNEGVAAVAAEQCVKSATDAAALSALRVIARDERSHEALAWDILGWAQSIEPRLVSDIVARELASLPQMRGDAIPAGVDVGVLVRHGRVDPTEWPNVLFTARERIAVRAANYVPCAS